MTLTSVEHAEHNYRLHFSGVFFFCCSFRFQFNFLKIKMKFATITASKRRSTLWFCFLLHLFFFKKINLRKWGSSIPHVFFFFSSSVSWVLRLTKEHKTLRNYYFLIEANEIIDLDLPKKKKRWEWFHLFRLQLRKKRNEIQSSRRRWR